MLHVKIGLQLLHNKALREGQRVFNSIKPCEYDILVWVRTY